MKLVLLPGMDGTGRLFGPLCAALPAGLEAVVVGYPVDRPLGYEGLTEVARAALPRGEPFVIVAESFSGPVGLRLAAEDPPGLVGLVLVATFLRHPVPWARGVAVPGGLLPLLTTHLTARIALVGLGAPASLAAEVVACVRSVSPAVWSARLSALRSLDAADALAACRAPILALRGDADRLVGRRAMAPIERAPRVTCRTIRGPHLLLQAEPEAGAEAVGAWLRIVQDVTG